jgi:hypothetical protein
MPKLTRATNKQVKERRMNLPNPKNMNRMNTPSYATDGLFQCDLSQNYKVDWILKVNKGEITFQG